MARHIPGIRIVYNKLLGGWYIVRGPHQTPLNGRFNSKEEAQAWLDRPPHQKAQRNPSITPEAHELYLFAISDGDLYRQQGEPIVKNLARKMAKGIFRRDLAVKLYSYLADNAAKKYTFEHGDPGSARAWQQVKGFGIFTTSARREAAHHLLDHYMEQIDATARVLRAKQIKHPMSGHYGPEGVGR